MIREPPESLPPEFERVMRANAARGPSGNATGWLAFTSRGSEREEDGRGSGGSPCCSALCGGRAFRIGVGCRAARRLGTRRGHRRLAAKGSLTDDPSVRHSSQRPGNSSSSEYRRLMERSSVRGLRHAGAGHVTLHRNFARTRCSPASRRAQAIPAASSTGTVRAATTCRRFSLPHDRGDCTRR